MKVSAGFPTLHEANRLRNVHMAGFPPLIVIGRASLRDGSRGYVGFSQALDGSIRRPLSLAGTIAAE